MSLENIINPGLVEEVREQIGDGLRVVGSYYERDYEISYIRPDVAEQYSELDRAQIFEDFLMEAMAVPISEHVYGRPRRCQIQVLDEIVVFHFHIDDVSGHAVSFDISALPELCEFVETCNSHIVRDG